MLERKDAETLVKMMSKLWKELDHNSENKNIINNFLYMSVMAVRSYTNGITSSYISIKARKILTEKSVEVKNHNGLNKANKKIGTSGSLVIDHLYPVNLQMREYFTGKISLKQLFDNAEEQAIILKEENRLLNTKYKNERPKGWEEAYSEFDIETEPYTYKRITRSNR